MEKKVTIEKLLKKINHENAIDLIDLVFDNLKEENEYGENLLHILVNEIHNEEKCIIAIEALLKLGVNVNHLDNFKYNFIQTAIDTGYSQKFIVKCIELSLKYKLDVNNVEEDGDTIIHTALNADNYTDNIDDLLRVLVKNGYNPTLKNKNGLTLDDILYRSNKYTMQEKRNMNYDISDWITYYLRQCKNRSKR